MDFAESRYIKSFLLIAVLLWTLVLSASLFFTIYNMYYDAQDALVVQARTAFEKDIVYRKWNIQMGSVFAPESETIIANPYLDESIRTVTTEDGRVLVRINPAYMTRLAHKIGVLESGIIGHIASKDSMHPENAPDEWEAAALEAFEEGDCTEVSALQFIDGVQYMRLMRPLVTEERCLSCHYDYINGNLRGGISVSVPVEPIMRGVERTMMAVSITYTSIWIAGLLLLLWGGRKILMKMRQRDEAEIKLYQLTVELENRVQRRTDALRMRQRELDAFLNNANAAFYLKDKNNCLHVANRALQTVLGYKGDDKHIPEKYAKFFAEAEERVFREHTTVTLDDTLFEDNKVYTVTLFPVYNDEQQLEWVGAVFVDVTERKSMEEAIKAAKEASESAARAKSDLLANVSHELRTPLNGIIGTVELMLRTDLDTNQATMASTIKTASNNLLSVLNDILDFSKVDANKIELDITEFVLQDLIMDTVRGQEALAKKKGIELRAELPPLPAQVAGDTIRIRQILFNLLSNAIKFTEEGGVLLRVDILGKNESDIHLNISVTDTGIGISKDNQYKIFEAFEQVDASTTRKYGGTGLGLSIASRLAAMMGSELKLESEPGKGSCFSFELKLPYIESQDADNAKKSITVSSMPLNILLAEDMQINQMVASQILSELGHNVQIAENGQIAVNMYENSLSGGRSLFDLIFMDIQMPIMDGVEATARIRELERENNSKYTIIVAMTAHALKGDEEKFMSSGMDAYIAKPVMMDKLIELIEDQICVINKQ